MCAKTESNRLICYVPNCYKVLKLWRPHFNRNFARSLCNFRTTFRLHNNHGPGHEGTVINTEMCLCEQILLELLLHTRLGRRRQRHSPEVLQSDRLRGAMPVMKTCFVRSMKPRNPIECSPGLGLQLVVGGLGFRIPDSEHVSYVFV